MHDITADTNHILIRLFIYYVLICMCECLCVFVCKAFMYLACVCSYWRVYVPTCTRAVLFAYLPRLFGHLLLDGAPSNDVMTSELQIWLMQIRPQ
jgi:hypothetical protein